MEIVTYILDGNLTHKDNMGTSESLSRGSIQFMTAGTGVQHSEHNLSTENPLRFIQTWILPRSRSLKPNYGSFPSTENLQEERTNKWLHLVGDVNNKLSSKIQINQDCNLYVAEIDAGNSLSFDLMDGRQGYLVCVEGTSSINGTELLRHEAFEVTGTGENSLVVQGNAGKEKSHLMLFEMAAK
jgi:quercetin 2,3-dioxygenase